MRTWFESLRVRLAAFMVLMFVIGAGLAMMLEPFDDDAPGGILPGINLLREPYQDFLILVPLGLCAVGLTWFVSGWSLRDVAAASREAAAIGAGNAERRISERSLPLEVRPLVHAVNGALERLGDAYAAERRFVGNAAHQLRTPLAVLSLRLQRARSEGDPDWPAIERDLAQVNRLVDQLLDLARKEHVAHGDAAGWPIVNLCRIAREAAALVAPLAEQAHRDLTVDLPDRMSVRGQAHDLRDMVRNLLENALLHGRGTIALAGRTDGDAVILGVGDEGAGIPPERQAEVVERFSKLRAESAGHGLGLAIVSEVARGHGGTLAFPDGPRFLAQVTLPEADAVESAPARPATPLAEAVGPASRRIGQARA